MVTAPKIVLRFLVLSCFIFVFPFQLVGQAEAANITLSGTLYTDEGVTVGTSGKTIKIAVGTSTVSVHSTTTVSGGVWSIDNIDDANLSTTTPFTVWLDGDANDATTMVMGYSGSNITSIPLYYAFTIAHGTSSTATVNVGSYSFYDIDDDTDILYKVTATSTVVSSDLLIKQGVFSAPTTTLSISGNYKNSGTYTNNYGSIFLTGASKTLSGTLTGTSALYDLNVIGSYIISTTSASTTNLVISSTGSLTASSSLTVASNFANQGTFNSNSGTLYMENAKDEVITYLKGVDARGDNTGTGNVLISGFAIKGDYLYVAKGGSATACSQTVGAAGVAGCELQVYDISSSTNPTYVAGRDVLGDGTSATASRMYSLAISGNYLYVGKASNANPCSQTAGDSGVNGCEIQVYDISSSTNPIYVAGRDASGDSTGVGSSIVYSLTISGNYLYVGKSGSGTACSQTAGSAIGCELQVYDISSSTNPTYVVGRDARGDSTGAGGIGIKSLLIRDNYLYVGKGGSVTNCSQTAGAVGVQGCELMVFDISSTTNPVYKAGRDSSGDTTGAASADGYLSMVILDNYLYLGKDPDNAACTQVAGSAGANGCEIQVYDISSSTNPLYKAGRDSSGSSDGVGGLMVNSLVIVNNQLYVAKDSGATACSQAAGFADGCELMVFDISSTTNPVYIVGRDDSGSNIGTDVTPINAIINNGKYIYIGKDNDTTACSQTAGAAHGCELMIFDTVSGFVSGTLNATSSFNNLTILDGLVNVVSIASTTNFFVSSGATFVAPSAFTVGGNYTNNGTSSFNEESDYLYLSSTSAQTLSGTLTGSSILPNTIFSGSGTKTFSNNASTTNFTIDIGATVVSPTVLTILGDYVNNGTHTQTGSTAEIKSYIRKYLAGLDIGGTSTGVVDSTVYSIAKSGNYLYLGKAGDATACSQTAGSAIGCELMVFDISSSTNPVYVAGRDSSGDSTGVGSSLIYSIVTSNNYMYIGKAASSTACSQTAGSAEGCELMVFDISSSTNPVYVAGRDGSGSAAGTGAILITYLNAVGNSLYAGKGSYGGSACSQTAGLAHGCELMVFDISSSTNPTYVAGRDSTGSSGGSGSVAAYFITSSGNSLFLSKASDATACSQTAGSAEGCELMVFDISSSTNPVYVAGRDSTGDNSGVGNTVVYTLAVGGSYLYAGKYNDYTACSQTAGSAEGCELMVFDISSSTNPTYVAGRDTAGAVDGATVGGSAIASMVSFGDYLYVGRGGASRPCSQVAGSANGCELMVFDIASNVSGTMTGSSAFNNLSVYGSTTISNNASTTNLTIATSSILTAPSYLTVAGDLSNYGTYTHNNGTVILSGTNQDLISPATTTFYNLTKSVSSADTLTFTAGGTYVTEGELTLTGTSGNRLSLRSSSTTGEWYIDPQATATVSYLDVKDSENINVTVMSCLTDCLNSGNNTNWEFTEPISLVSADNYHFYVGQSTTTLDTVTVTKQSSESNITSANDIRIHISTSTTNFYFDISNTTLTFGGTASGKVSGTVSYEDHSTTLVINVTSDFTVNDTLTIAGIRVGSFGSVSTTSSQFLLFSGGNTTGVADTEDTKTINISGSLTLGNHSQGRASNQFSFQDKNDETMFTFSVVPNNENATITDMVITLSGIQGVDSDEVNDFKLYRDLNSDGNGDVGGGDELIDSNGILTINGQHGAITFSTDFLATSTSDYIVTFDTSNVDRDDSFMVSLLTSGVTAIGVTSVYSSYILGSVNNTQHIREGANAGGSMARIGDDAPAGNGIVTGGEENGGGGVGEEVDGENIAHDPNFIKPSATGDIDNEWTNPSNALNSDGSYATAGSATLKQSYNGFSFGIPGGNTILGIEVKVDASGSTSNGTIDVALSWDGGSSYTTGKATPTLSGTDIIYNVGGSGDTWGRSWTATEFNPTNFRLRVTANPSSNTLRLDALEVRVYHQSTGGGGGGGGGI